ncbi:RNA polymerase sigma factor [Acidomonas methanolica]|uniref:RNA polymerase sigma factor n=1 Tax=Acidomonas methanolica NBRC 104435 TaxID=1231351 RepID=A0A023D8E7_ACIMT|nr:RNA polymerase sigma factor [Acidomonas methanolica]MBU2654780.1 RNA polymerase sigma factor [Acidomonas methanolica]TCS26362.1 RNA polymerase sigma-70 factor (ECF subfamily) [Acidomonas methanolica]GAJ30413.1 DNA-directed RNA polymerase sigma factor [Acidomonas methanolica NBRC 104435]GBQ57476.1 RNA polymerase sigma-24 factor [Acidomonas methanolica]GEL00520.1 RNA polymerase sigma factor [Acidomonas methanolica NBRC 104435]
MEVRDPDVELLRQVAQGDERAARRLVAARLPRVLAFATRVLGERSDAEDVAQEVFLRVWRHAGRWRAGTARFDTWLHTVTLNLCRDRIRRRRETLIAEPPDLPDPTPDAQARMEAAAGARSVATAIASLPERQKLAIILVHYQEMSNIEAATIMSVSVEALESLLSRGRRTLRHSLTGEERRHD